MNVGVRVELRMQKAVVDKLDKLASIEFETRSNIIRRAVNKYLSEFDFVKADKTTGGDKA